MTKSHFLHTYNHRIQIPSWQSSLFMRKSHIHSRLDEQIGKIRKSQKRVYAPNAGYVLNISAIPLSSSLLFATIVYDHSLICRASRRPAIALPDILCCNSSVSLFKTTRNVDRRQHPT